MTWSASIPNAGESPALFPAQAQTNWARLNAIITADHLFSTTSSSDQGYHKIVHWVNQGGDLGDNSPAPSTGVGQLYTKTVTTTGNVSSTAGASEHICFQPGTGGGALQESSITACPLRAAVSFQGRTSAGAVTINFAHNVSSVTRNSTGSYTINFTTNMPSIYYIPQITASRTTNENPSTIIGVPKGGTYTNAFAVDTFTVFFSRTTTQEFKDPNTACLMFYGG